VSPQNAIFMLNMLKNAFAATGKAYSAAPNLLSRLTYGRFATHGVESHHQGKNQAVGSD